jgi:hypothetical protein
VPRRRLIYFSGITNESVVTLERMERVEVSQAAATIGWVGMLL